MSICLLENPKDGAILAKTYSFPLSFLHAPEIRSSKFIFQSSLTPSNFLHFFKSHIIHQKLISHVHEQLHFHCYLLVNDICQDYFLKDYYQTIGIRQWKLLLLLI